MALNSNSPEAKGMSGFAFNGTTELLDYGLLEPYMLQQFRKPRYNPAIHRRAISPP
jgi:hypothetical protein